MRSFILGMLTKIITDAAKDADAGRRIYSKYRSREEDANIGMIENDTNFDMRRYYSFDVAPGNSESANCRFVISGGSMDRVAAHR